MDTLTVGQQGVISMYDSEIARTNRHIAQAESAWVAGTGSYEEIRYLRDELTNLRNERRETLEAFESAAVSQ